ncbi:hypothetical protein AAG906_011484 [Vitis piasezkii]
MTSTQKPHFSGSYTFTFLREYGISLSNFVFLHLPTGAEWPVELLKLHGEVLFSSGWQRFADFYSIGYGHFLLFRYEGSSHFHVLIFDMTASEIEYPYATAPNHYHNHHKVSVESLDDFPSSKTANYMDMIDITSSEAVFYPNGASSLPKITRNNPSFKPHNVCSSHHYHPSIPISRVRNVCLSGALERAKSFKFEKPFFIITMRPSYVGSKKSLTVPLSFVKRHFKRDNNNTILSVSDGRTWSVKYIKRKNNVQFSSGWTKFVRDNSLEVGDVCAFELVKCTGTSLKVEIFRNNEDASHHLQQ